MRSLVPEVVFQTRVRNDKLSGPNPYEWKEVNTIDLFDDGLYVLFALPGAFTPTCTNEQLPGYERLYEEFIEAGVDEVYCLSVNDAFVMNQWARSLDIQDVKMLPDGNGEFTRLMGMLVDKSNLGFGMRSWRYAIVIDRGRIVGWFIEDEDIGGAVDLAESDPYEESHPLRVLDFVEDYAKSFLDS